MAPTKRKAKKKKPADSSRAEKPGAKSSAELEDDDVEQVNVSDEEGDPWSAPPFPPRKKQAKGGESGAGAKKPATVASSASEDESGAGSAAPDGHNILPLQDSFCDSVDVTARADKLCQLAWIGSTLLANCLPLKFRRILYLDGNYGPP